MRELARDFALVREEVVSRKRDIGFAPSSSVQDVIRYAAELLGQDNIAIRWVKVQSQTFEGFSH